MTIETAASPDIGPLLREVHRLAADVGFSIKHLSLISGVPERQLLGTDPGKAELPLPSVAPIALALGADAVALSHLWMLEYADFLADLVEPPFSLFSELEAAQECSRRAWSRRLAA